MGCPRYVPEVVAVGACRAGNSAGLDDAGYCMLAATALLVAVVESMVSLAVRAVARAAVVVAAARNLRCTVVEDLAGFGDVVGSCARQCSSRWLP